MPQKTKSSQSDAETEMELLNELDKISESNSTAQHRKKRWGAYRRGGTPAAKYVDQLNELAVKTKLQRLIQEGGSHACAAPQAKPTRMNPEDAMAIKLMKRRYKTMEAQARGTPTNKQVGPPKLENVGDAGAAPQDPSRQSHTIFSDEWRDHRRKTIDTMARYRALQEKGNQGSECTIL